MSDKIKCGLCGRLLLDTFRSKWRHVVKVHPEAFLSKIAPLMANPEVIRKTGEALGRELLERFIR